MTGRTHDMAAVAGLLGVILLYPPTHINLATASVALLANLIGGIAPDIDEPTAPFWRNLPIGGMVGRIFTRLLGGHRFLTHSLIGVVLIALLFHWFLVVIHPITPALDINLIWYSFIIGVLSHLFMDSLTKEGVPWLLPIPVKFGFPPIKALRVTTGKAIESLVVFPGLIALTGWIIYSHYHIFTNLLHSL